MTLYMLETRPTADGGTVEHFRPLTIRERVTLMQARGERVVLCTFVAAAIPASLAVAVVLGAPASGLPACESEDGTDCVWIADESGNGRGRSFVELDGVL